MKRWHPYAGQPILQAIGEQHGLGFLMADGTLMLPRRRSSPAPTATPRFEQYYTNVPANAPRDPVR